MTARALMFQGTGSSVGKSLIVAGLCRAFARRGLRVAPFKPQNMSNNAAVTPEGGEIGRAQALQARAAGIAPSVHMNPVLLKPQSEIGAQIVLRGHVVGAAPARAWQARKREFLPAVMESFATLGAAHDLVLVEGAGSTAEVNLRENDIANMGFARAAGLPVVLIGDIDRGGVIASVIGTKTVLAAEDEALIKGFIINRMRGDASLFADGMDFIAARTGWTALGLVPFFAQARHLPAEDAADLAPSAATAGRLRLVVPLLPHIANFDDLDPLFAEPDIALTLAPRGAPLPPADVILLPGSKATRADLAALRAEGWDIDLLAHHRRGGALIGICGGFQMLGEDIADPDGIEGEAGHSPGLGLLAFRTVLGPAKRLAEVAGVNLLDQTPVRGYEMHLGESCGPALAHPLHRLADGRAEGAASLDRRVFGTYLHGMFADDAARAGWLARFGAASRLPSFDHLIETTLDALADHLARHIDLAALLSLAR